MDARTRFLLFRAGALIVPVVAYGIQAVHPRASGVAFPPFLATITAANACILALNMGDLGRAFLALPIGGALGFALGHCAGGETSSVSTGTAGFLVILTCFGLLISGVDYVFRNFPYSAGQLSLVLCLAMFPAFCVLSAAFTGVETPFRRAFAHVLFAYLMSGTLLGVLLGLVRAEWGFVGLVFRGFGSSLRAVAWVGFLVFVLLLLGLINELSPAALSVLTLALANVVFVHRMLNVIEEARAGVLEKLALPFGRKKPVAAVPQIAPAVSRTAPANIPSDQPPAAPLTPEPSGPAQPQ